MCFAKNLVLIRRKQQISTLCGKKETWLKIIFKTCTCTWYEFSSFMKWPLISINNRQTIFKYQLCFLSGTFDTMNMKKKMAQEILPLRTQSLSVLSPTSSLMRDRTYLLYWREVIMGVVDWVTSLSPSSPSSPSSCSGILPRDFSCPLSDSSISFSSTKFHEKN